MKALLAALLALALLPAGALAVEQEGEGANIRHLTNLPHSELHDATQTQQATDLELATLTLPGPPAAKARTKLRCTKVRKGKGKRKVRRCKRVPLRDVNPKAPGIQRTFAFAGSYYDGLDIIDVTEQASPKKVATYDCGIGQGDVQIFRRDGKAFLAYAQDDGYDQHESACTKEAVGLGFPQPSSASGGTYIVDITDPAQPRTVSFVPVPQGSHNTTVHPSGRYLYNSNADLITSIAPSLEVIDISDLAHPKIAGELALQPFPGLGTESHDISFNASGTRAYVAALSHGEILDTTDPAHPKSITTIIDPAINVWHQTEELTIDGRSFLIAEDEFAGAEGTAQCPNGGLHIWDITDEQAPMKVGAYNIDDIGVAPGNDLANGYVARCTAHVFQLHREAKLMVMGWYNAGVRILDLSKLDGITIGNTGNGIKQLGWFKFPDSDTWAAKTATASRAGFVFYGNDKRRGLDVYRYEPKAGAKVRPGRWLTPRQALANARRARAAGPPQLWGLCFVTPRSAAR
jgi:hypothetical protein